MHISIAHKNLFMLAWTSLDITSYILLILICFVFFIFFSASSAKHLNLKLILEQLTLNYFPTSCAFSMWA